MQIGGIYQYGIHTVRVLRRCERAWFDKRAHHRWETVTIPDPSDDSEPVNSSLSAIQMELIPGVSPPTPAEELERLKKIEAAAQAWSAYYNDPLRMIGSMATRLTLDKLLAGLGPDERKKP